MKAPMTVTFYIDIIKWRSYGQLQEDVELVALGEKDDIYVQCDQLTAFSKNQEI